MDIVSFVILHYKDLETTDLCVQSILRMEQRERIRIVIVDNDVNDPPEKRQRIQDKYAVETSVQVLRIEKNGGFSYANNQGFAYAREKQRAACIVVLNNDIEFTQTDFVERLEHIYQEYPCHVLGPDVIRRSTGEHQNPMDERVRTIAEAEYTRRMNQKALRWYSLIYPLLYWKNNRNEEKKLRQRLENEVYYQAVHEGIVPFGACLIYMPEFVKNETKAFSPETNFYYEEYILTSRCKKKGYRIIYHPDIVALHESGAATKKSYGSEKKRMRFTIERIAAACEVYIDYMKTIDL